MHVPSDITDINWKDVYVEESTDKVVVAFVSADKQKAENFRSALRNHPFELLFSFSDPRSRCIGIVFSDAETEISFCAFSNMSMQNRAFIKAIKNAHQYFIRCEYQVPETEKTHPLEDGICVVKKHLVKIEKRENPATKS